MLFYYIYYMKIININSIKFLLTKMAESIVKGQGDGSPVPLFIFFINIFKYSILIQAFWKYARRPRI